MTKPIIDLSKERVAEALNKSQAKSISRTIDAMSEEDIKSLIEDATQAALNAGCLVIQERIGQTDGGPAGMVFSDSRFLEEKFREYFNHELWLSHED